MPWFDLNVKPTDLAGRCFPYKGENGKEVDLTLKDALKEAAIFMEVACPFCRKPTEEMDNARAIDLVLLAKRLRRSNGYIELENKETTDLQERIGKAFKHNMVLRAELVELLENPVQKPETNSESNDD